MFKSMDDCFELSNGVKIPCVGYGTWRTPNGQVACDGVAEALRLGYKHIDTAYVYGNETGVGEGIKKSGVKREDFFLTTKHWVTYRGYEKTLEAVDVSLKQLGVDYLDLYLIHWPCVEVVTPQWKEINAETWRGFEAAYKAGKLRAIGVSNFEVKHLDALLETCEIKPMVNQIEFHPGYTQLENVQYSKKLGMVVEAWSPLGSGAVLGDERLVKLAQKYNKSVAQLCVRFALQNGNLPLPKSVHFDRIKSNMDVFDFEITPEDMAYIMSFDTLGYSGLTAEEGPADGHPGKKK